MNEDYVSLEVAKLLKEKGFDWLVNHYYNKFGNFNNTYGTWENYSDLVGELMISAPTLCMAQKWLRETKGIYIWVEPVIGHRWTVSFCDLNVCEEESDWIERELHKDGYPIYDSYEDALNAGILEALKLI